MTRVLLLTVATSVLFMVFAWLRTAMWTYGADTGTFAQVISDSFNGMRNGIEHGTHYRYHWSPSLVLLWPVLALTRSALSLQIIQIVLTFTTAPLLYVLFRSRLSARNSFRLALLALMYPPLEAIAFNEFHELGLLSPIVVGAVLAADRRRWFVFALLVVVAAGIREDVCLEFAIIGVALAIVLRRTRPEQSVAAGATALLALSSLGIYYGMVVPHVGAWRPASFYRYPFADGPIQVVHALITRPAVALPTFLTFGRLTYLLEAVTPVAFLPLRTVWGAATLPGFCVILLANTGLVWRMGMHYSALWIPWILIATGFAAANLTRTQGNVAATRWLTSAIAISALFLIAFNPMHPLHYLKPSYHDLTAASRSLQCVPKSASLSTHDEWFSAIAVTRPQATVGVIQGVDYLVYADDFPNAEFESVLAPELARAVKRGTYRIICVNNHTAAYKRFTPAAQRSHTMRRNAGKLKASIVGQLRCCVMLYACRRGCALLRNAVPDPVRWTGS